MTVHNIFAHIESDEIKNIIICDNYQLANQLAQSIYGEEAYAVECTQYPVSIGDKYINNLFYFKDGVTLVPRQNTAEEDAAQANATIIALKEENITTLEALAEVYENLVALQSTIDTTKA